MGRDVIENGRDRCISKMMSDTVFARFLRSGWLYADVDHDVASAPQYIDGDVVLMATQ